MNKGLSVYLEMVRVVATFLVLLSHAGHFGPLWLQDILGEARLGRDGVVLFFVLSGFVITWCGKEKDKNLYSFATNRMARIYSVAVPGLLLGIIASLIHTSVQGEPVDYTINKAWLYYPIFLTFYSQSWLGFLFPAGNFPYWSLSYEVWYYVFIAVVLYANRYRWLLIFAVVLIMGPYIALFLPLWGMGALLYVCKDKYTPGRGTALFLFAATLLGFIATKVTAFDSVLDEFNHYVLGSPPKFIPAKQFLGDYFLALLAVVNFYSAYHLRIRIGELATKAVKALACFSFSIYLYHTPLFLLLSLVPFFHDAASWTSYIRAVVFALVACRVLASFTELKKKPLKAAIDRTADHLLKISKRKVTAK